MTNASSVDAQLMNLRKELGRHHTQHLIWLLNGLKARLGDQVMEEVDALVAHDVREEWKAIAESEGSNTVDDLVRLLWEPLVEKGFAYSTFERTENKLEMRCTRCPIADLAKELNAQDWLYALNCACDEHIVAGFNPKMRFQRTKTLLEGDDYCDHTYFFQED